MATLYEVTSQNPTEFLSMTSYTLQEFEALLPSFEEELLKTKKTLERKERKRKYSPYSNSPLPSPADQLFFILVYQKQYPLQSMQGILFGMSQPKANIWIHFLSPILKAALATQGAVPLRSMEDVEKEDVEREDVRIFLHDGTERPIQRPKEEEKQKEFYSGKKKGHTVKNNVLSNHNCEVIYLTDTVAGKKHDKKLADESHYQLPAGSLLFQDTGFQGFSLEKVEIIQPQKKPRGKELTEEEKDKNREISTLRIRIEHVISGIKRCRIVKDTFRNYKKGFKDWVMEIACALHNFRLKFRPWREIDNV